MTTDPKDALPPRLDPTCTCVCHTQPGVMHVAPCCRETDPRDTEIARLTAEVETLTTSGIIEVAARNPNVMSYIQHWETRTEKAEAERDAALAQVAALREVVKFHERLTVDPSTLSRRDAQMRAEGRKDGLREAAEVLEGLANEWDSFDCRLATRAILAAAEKEKGNG